MTYLISFPALVQYGDIEARMTYDGQAETATWAGKLKIHGANHCVLAAPGEPLSLQSRATILSDTEHAAGFVRAQRAQEALWNTLDARGFSCVSVYGEWAGAGVQRGQEAINRLAQPVFFIFAIGYGAVPHPQEPTRIVPEWMITDPKAIAAALPEGLERVHVLPWMTTPFTLDFGHMEGVARVIADVNDIVERLETRDDYICNLFGVEGTGEGCVFTPLASDIGELPGHLYGRLSFKMKVTKHRVRKQAKPAVVREAPPESAHAFVETYVTQARCEQGRQEACNFVFDKKLTGAFVAWMIKDVEKESGRDLEQMNLSFDVVRSLVQAAARTWYISHC